MGLSLHSFLVIAGNPLDLHFGVWLGNDEQDQLKGHVYIDRGVEDYCRPLITGVYPPTADGNTEDLVWVVETILYGALVAASCESIFPFPQADIDLMSEIMSVSVRDEEREQKRANFRDTLSKRPYLDGCLTLQQVDWILERLRADQSCDTSQYAT